MVTEVKDKKILKLKNWQIFLMGKLNELYQKNEQCNITLKFEDGKSIQAHKLVLASCTNYFDPLPSGVMLKLPQTMSHRHVKPIIDFMYTGKLEYNEEDHQGVVTACKAFNITVLTELLQVETLSLVKKQTEQLLVKNYIQKVERIEKNRPEITTDEMPTFTPGNMPAVTPTNRPAATPTNRPAATPTNRPAATPTNRPAATPTNRPAATPSNTPLNNPTKSLKVASNVTLPGKKLPFWKKRTPSVTLPDDFYSSIKAKPPPKIEEERKPTRFEWPEEETLPLVDTSSNLTLGKFENLSYDSRISVPSTRKSKPIVLEDSITQMPETVIPHGTKRPRASEVVKGLSDDEEDYDDGHFESIHDLDDDVEDEASVSSVSMATPPKPILKTVSTPTPSKKVRFSFSDEKSPAANEPQTPPVRSSTPQAVTPTIITNPVAVSTPQTITNSSSSSNSVDTSKIVSEILKKFPDLAKNKKNIKLKIQTGKSTFPGSDQSIATTKDGKKVAQVQYIVLKSDQAPIKKEINNQVLMGPENRTGPWFCVVCGDEKGPMTFDTYYLYRRHLHDTHNERIDARICEHCGFKASKRNLHLYHLYTKHKIAPPRNINFPKCDQCDYIALSESLLIKHRNNHTGMATTEYVCRICNAAFKSNGALMGHMQTNLHQTDQSAKKDYKCIYCNKIFNRNINLKAHMRTSHQLETIKKMYEDEDRIEDPLEVPNRSDGDEQEQSRAQSQEQSSQSLMEVIEVPMYESGGNKTLYLPQGMTILAESPSVPLMPSSESEAMNNVATGIATSINIADRNIPNEVIVLDNQSELIIQGAPTTYVLNTDGSYTVQEYIVPEIMSDSGRVYTTALVSSAPSTGITYNNISIVATSSDHTYADGMKINGHVSSGTQVNLMATSCPTVITSPIQVSQANQPIIVQQEPIIMNAEWIPTISSSQNLGQCQQVEIISAPVSHVNNGQQKVEIISASAGNSSKPPPEPGTGKAAQNLVSDWGDADDDDEDSDARSKEAEDEVKPSRPTIDLDTSIDNEM